MQNAENYPPTSVISFWPFYFWNRHLAQCRGRIFSGQVYIEMLLHYFVKYLSLYRMVQKTSCAILTLMVVMVQVHLFTVSMLTREKYSVTSTWLTTFRQAHSVSFTAVMISSKVLWTFLLFTYILEFSYLVLGLLFFDTVICWTGMSSSLWIVSWLAKKGWDQGMLFSG